MRSSRTCRIQAQGKEEHLRGLINAAEKNPLRKGSHIRPQVPSIEYEALVPSRGLKGFSRKKVALAKRLCQANP